MRRSNLDFPKDAVRIQPDRGATGEVIDARFRLRSETEDCTMGPFGITELKLIQTTVYPHISCSLVYPVTCLPHKALVRKLDPLAVIKVAQEIDFPAEQAFCARIIISAALRPAGITA